MRTSPTLSQALTWLQYGIFLGIIFLLPTNLFWVVFENAGYARGLFLDYVAPKLYVIDLLMISALVLEIGRKKLRTLRFSPQQKLIATHLFGWVSLLFVIQLARQNWVGLWTMLTTGLLLFFGWWLSTKPHFFQKKATYITWVGALVFQTILATYQFVFQRSLVGYFFFGEPTLTHAYGLAKIDWWGRELVLPYGTTPHPNILAGYAVISAVSLIWLWPKKKSLKLKWSQPVIFASVIWLILLTQSLTAGLSVILVALAQIGKRLWPNQLRHLTQLILAGSVIFFVIAPFGLEQANHLFSDNMSVNRRALLQTYALQFIRHAPLGGVGLTQFGPTLATQHLPTTVEQFVQPAHHTGLLWLAETGVVGMILLIATLRLGWKFRPVQSASAYQETLLLLALAPLASFDHYLITQHHAVLLAILAFVIWNTNNRFDPEFD